MRTRLRAAAGDILALNLPYLVAERSGRVVGYCYASRYRARSAYRFTLEDSIYVDAAEVGRGIGRALLSTPCSNVAPSSAIVRWLR